MKCCNLTILNILCLCFIANKASIRIYLCFYFCATYVQMLMCRFSLCMSHCEAHGSCKWQRERSRFIDGSYDPWNSWKIMENTLLEEYLNSHGKQFTVLEKYLLQYNFSADINCFAFWKTSVYMVFVNGKGKGVGLLSVHLSVSLTKELSRSYKSLCAHSSALGF